VLGPSVIGLELLSSLANNDVEAGAAALLSLSYRGRSACRKGQRRAPAQRLGNESS
jgi:hypothetical protein